MSLPCSNIQQGSGGCACAPPTTNFKKSTFYFSMAILGGLLLLAFNAVKGYEEDALNAQSLGMVLILGFLTGLHCIGMCGGFMMSYMRYGKETKMSEFQMHFRYSISKVVSYAFFGAVFGFMGSLVHFSANFKSIVSFVGGFFLLYLGAKGLGLFAKLKKLGIVDRLKLKTDRMANPISVGLLKGLMISCAPLQALYLVSASVGDPLKGALILGVFGIGTLPIFLFYGVFVGSLTKVQAKWSDIITAGIVVVFGILMINRGMALGGYELNYANIYGGNAVQINNIGQTKIGVQTLQMEATRNGWSKAEIKYTYGQKVRWEINATEVTVCNRTIEIPKLGISKDLEKGLNIIEFDPGNHTSLVYTCWMGMMKGTFVAE